MNSQHFHLNIFIFLFISYLSNIMCTIDSIYSISCIQRKERSVIIYYEWFLHLDLEKNQRSEPIISKSHWAFAVSLLPLNADIINCGAGRTMRIQREIKERTLCSCLHLQCRSSWHSSSDRDAHVRAFSLHIPTIRIIVTYDLFLLLLALPSDT